MEQNKQGYVILYKYNREAEPLDTVVALLNDAGLIRTSSVQNPKKKEGNLNSYPMIVQEFSEFNAPPGISETETGLFAQLYFTRHDSAVGGSRGGTMYSSHQCISILLSAAAAERTAKRIVSLGFVDSPDKTLSSSAGLYERPHDPVLVWLNTPLDAGTIPLGESYFRAGRAERPTTSEDIE